MPSAQDFTGQTVAGRYRLLELVGDGGFGRVYRAEDLRLGTEAAIKLIHPWWAQDDDWRARLVQEARVTAKLAHPNIVRVTDAGEDERCGRYIASEFVDGESLRERIDRTGPLTPQAAASVGAQVARALAVAHAGGVVHRDVKPSNVMLATDGRVLLCDFGVARLQSGATRSTSSHTAVGTPLYMAPEQATGAATGPAADQYALGVTLFEALTGRPPFDGENYVAVAMAHVGQPLPDLPASCPPALAAAVAQACAKLPADRLPDCATLATHLDAVSGNAPHPAPARVFGTGPTRRLARAPRPTPTAATSRLQDPEQPRRPWKLGLAAVLALVCAAGVTAWALSGPSGTETPLAAADASELTDTTEAVSEAEPDTSAADAAAELSAARVSVPELVGLSVAGARARAARRDLTVATVRRESVRQPAGRIVSQRPAAGEAGLRGDEVEVTVSTGPPPVPVPDLPGRSAAAAVALLNEAGLTARTVNVPGGGRDPGTVVSTKPSADTEVARGSVVEVRVARPAQWRTVGTYAFDSDGQTPRFTIKAERWRITYTMAESCSYESATRGCVGTSLALENDTTFETLDLSEGTHTTDIAADRGTYHFSFRTLNHNASLKLTIEEFR